LSQDALHSDGALRDRLSGAREPPYAIYMRDSVMPACARGTRYFLLAAFYEDLAP